MLIQNISNMAQAPQSVKIATDGLASDGGPSVVAASNQATSTSATPTGSPKTAVQPVNQQHSAAELQSFVDNINKTLKQADKNLVFSIDQTYNRTVIKVVDAQTGDVIREIPSKEAMAISQAIEQIQQGLLLKQKA